MEPTSEIKYIFWIGTSSMIFLALLIILLAIFYQNRIQAFKKQRAENLLNASLEVEKKERKRIASDLHDGVSGDLHAIRNFIEVLKLKKIDEESNEIINEIEAGIIHTQQDIKNISENLMPKELETQGLIHTLENHIVHLNKFPDFHIQIERTDTFKIDEIKAYELYRVIQELLSNILKHNSASTVKIKFINQTDSLCITVKDNGNIFDFYSNFNSSKGKGLKNIVSRLEYINGKIEQISTDGGNHIRISLNKNLC